MSKAPVWCSTTGLLKRRLPALPSGARSWLWCPGSQRNDSFHNSPPQCSITPSTPAGSLASKQSVNGSNPPWGVNNGRASPVVAIRQPAGGSAKRRFRLLTLLPWSPSGKGVESKLPWAGCFCCPITSNGHRTIRLFPEIPIPTARWNRFRELPEWPPPAGCNARGTPQFQLKTTSNGMLSGIVS